MYFFFFKVLLFTLELCDCIHFTIQASVRTNTYWYNIYSVYMCLSVSELCCCGHMTTLAEIQYEIDILGVKGPRKIYFNL